MAPYGAGLADNEEIGSVEVARRASGVASGDTENVSTTATYGDSEVAVPPVSQQPTGIAEDIFAAVATGFGGWLVMQRPPTPPPRAPTPPPRPLETLPASERKDLPPPAYSKFPRSGEISSFDDITPELPAKSRMEDNDFHCAEDPNNPLVQCKREPTEKPMVHISSLEGETAFADRSSSNSSLDSSTSETSFAVLRHNGKVDPLTNQKTDPPSPIHQSIDSLFRREIVAQSRANQKALEQQIDSRANHDATTSDNQNVTTHHSRNLSTAGVPLTSKID